ncbi:MAG: toprim domain-containing protein, partial [Tenuifilaceae bacterium]|nr:toprim domain-containing protein [Tenuifilaceae bacterium]
QRIAAEEISNWLHSNPKEAKSILDKALVSKKAREAAKRARAAVKGKLAPKKAALKMPSKLADAYSSNRKNCELFITEGDSASGGMKEARDNEFQAILPVRGKILNTLKAPLDKALANAEINAMIRAFGLEFNNKTGKIIFDENDLRYGKIIIASDADQDGSHIQSLFYTFLWTFIPELIKQEYVYASVPPLYKIILGKEYVYLKDDDALQEFKIKNPTKKFIVNRLKGLGELDPHELEETMLDKKNRVLKQITMKDSLLAGDLFNKLMGDSAAARKKYIEEHSQEIEVRI